MSILFGKKKNLNSDAVTLPAARPTNHIHQSSEAGRVLAEYFGRFAVGVLSVAVLYLFTLHLIKSAGYNNPARIFATSFYYVAAAGALLAVVSIIAYIINWLLLSAIKANKEAAAEIEQIKYERTKLELQLLAAPKEGSSRLLDRDYKLMTLLHLVMHEAYLLHPFEGSARPWSRTGAKKWFSDSISPLYNQAPQELHREVAPWLKSKGVIDNKGKDIAIGDYPDLFHFNKLLEQEFNKPIQVNGPALPREKYN